MKNFFALTIAVLALSVFVHVQPVQAQQVAVPNVSGAEYNAAVKTLQAAGFKTSTTMEKTATPAQNGMVSKQKPEAGQKADKNSVVVLTVYLYVKTVNVAVAPPVTPPATPQQAPIPMVNNMHIEKAREIAKKSGYDLTVSSYRDQTNKALHDYVVEQQFAVPKGSKSFSVVVARYKAPIPNVITMTLQQAKATLTQAGYDALVTEALADAPNNGKIVGQNWSVNPGTNKVGVTVGVFGNGKTVNGIPNVVGIQEAQAVEMLKKAGFTVKTNYQDLSSPEFQGKVFGFYPETVGSKTVLISVGKTNLAPNFIGQTAEQVWAWDSNSKKNDGQRAIRISMGYKDVIAPDRVGKVLEQNPASGAKIAMGSQITVIVGKAPPPPPKPMLVPDVFNLSREEAWKNFDASGCSVETGIKETAWPEQDGKVIWMDVAPKTVCKKDVKVGIKVGKFTPSALDVRAVPIPDNNNYMLMVKGGTPPYDVRASFDVPKNVFVAGTKYCEIVPLKDNPPGWISYRVSPRADMTARFTITDSKGVKHQYDVTMKKDAK